MSFPNTRWKTPFVVALLAGLGIAGWQLLYAAEAPVVIPFPAVDNPKSAHAPQTAVLAGGCFWGVQGVFEHVRGVHKVVSGYAGGDSKGANYRAVSSGSTGHAESVQITFDPAEVSYGQLLQIFFSVVHDPTQLNRQGPDSGTQYRSAIFYADESQKKVAQAYIAQLDASKAFPAAIVTRVDSLKGFFPAEEYHQDFLIRNPRHPYIVFNDLPKVENFKRVFPGIYREQAVMVGSAETK